MKGTSVLGYGLLPESDVVGAERRAITVQKLCAFFTVPIVTIGPTLFHGPLEMPAGSSPFVLPSRWVCLSALTLFWAVANVKSKRYPDKDRPQAVIDGLDKSDPSIAMPMAFLSNTVEQLVLHVAGMFGLAATVSSKWLPLIPATAVLFVVARILFYISYSRSPVMRAYAFALTFISNLGMLVYICLDNIVGVDILAGVDILLQKIL